MRRIKPIIKKKKAVPLNHLSRKIKRREINPKHKESKTSYLPEDRANIRKREVKRTAEIEQDIASDVTRIGTGEIETVVPNPEESAALVGERKKPSNVSYLSPEQEEIKKSFFSSGLDFIFGWKKRKKP